MDAPFPYFGSKKTIAHKVWNALGQPSHYIEPFFGSGAVLLQRPDYKPTTTETVCDKDGFVANVWRAIRFDPDEVAKWCDWPVNHADLMARRRVLVKNEDRLLDNLVANDMWYDAKLAGYWIWAASCWIGTGLMRLNAIPHVNDAGVGVHRLGGQSHGRFTIREWMADLSERLRNVRVVCGDWTRVCGGNWQDKQGAVGMFFDPPYGDVGRDKNIYHHESLTVSDDVRRWCIDRGKSKTYRIVLAGYDEHKSLLKHGWACETWKANGGYGNQGEGAGKENRHRECLYYSPHCIRQEYEQMSFLNPEPQGE